MSTGKGCVGKVWENGGMSENEAPVLRATLDKKPEHIASMFDHVASRYDLTNTLLTGGMSHVWLHSLRKAANPQPGDYVLDLAAGTGSSTAVLAKSGARVVAADLSEGMIEVGRQRHPDLEFVHANALDLPFDDDTFDMVTISYGLRNIPDTDLALREMLRVTKPGGKVVIMEFSTPPNATFRKFYHAHQKYVMPMFSRLFSSDMEAYDYLVESIRAWPDQVALGRKIKAAGWDKVEYRNLTGGIVALHRARKPVK